MHFAISPRHLQVGTSRGFFVHPAPPLCSLTQDSTPKPDMSSVPPKYFYQFWKQIPHCPLSKSTLEKATMRWRESAFPSILWLSFLRKEGYRPVSQTWPCHTLGPLLWKEL